MADEGADLLVFGEEDLDIYVYNPANSRYEVQDRGSRDIIAAYPFLRCVDGEGALDRAPPDLRAKFPPRPKGEHLYQPPLVLTRSPGPAN